MSRENVEAMVIKWLNDTLADYHASSDTPKTLPKRYILVERTGGAREAMLGDNAEILIEIYDKGLRSDCSEMANWIADHVHQLAEVYDNITIAKVNSVIALDDNDKQYHRYQIYVDVFHSRVDAYSDTPPTPTPIPSA